MKLSKYVLLLLILEIYFFLGAFGAMELNTISISLCYSLIYCKNLLEIQHLLFFQTVFGRLFKNHKT